MKTISERGRERPTQDKTKSDIKIGMQVEVCNQTSYFAKYNGQVGIIEDIGNCPCVGTHGGVLHTIYLRDKRVLLLYSDEIEIVKDEEQ